MSHNRPNTPPLTYDKSSSYDPPPAPKKTGFINDDGKFINNEPKPPDIMKAQSSQAITAKR